jgi:hypothetical protein
MTAFETLVSSGQSGRDAESPAGSVSDHPIASVESQLQAIVRGYHAVLQEGAYKLSLWGEPENARPHLSHMAYDDERWVQARERFGDSESQDLQVSTIIVPFSQLSLILARVIQPTAPPSSSHAPPLLRFASDPNMASAGRMQFNSLRDGPVDFEDDFTHFATDSQRAY